MQEVEARMENLPRDVVLDIFSRLPISSLMQVKKLCRSWRAFVQDPALPCMYHAHLGERDPFIIIQREEIPCQDHLQLYVVRMGDRDGCCRYIINTTGGNIQSEPSSRELYVAGSYGGLLCVSEKQYHDSFYVINPFVSEYVELPKLTAQNPYKEVAIGFGVSPTTREYKIVRIAYYEKYHMGSKFTTEYSDVHVFTIGTDAWRHGGFAPWRLDCTPSEATVNGAFHWVTRRYDYEPLHLHIISFHIENEQFKEIQRPYNCDYLDIHDYHLVVIRGCLSIAAPFDDKIEIWMMKEYNVRESWTKELTIAEPVPLSLRQRLGCSIIHMNRRELPKRSIQVLCVLKSGEVLLECEGGRGLLLYNPAGEEFNELIIYEIPKRGSTMVHNPSPFPIEAILHI